MFTSSFDERSLLPLLLNIHCLMLRRPDLICSLRYLGEDDVLDRLTSDCASSDDEPPKIVCECCTECYVSADDLPTLASLTLPNPEVDKISETNVPTNSPTFKEKISSRNPTVRETKEPNNIVNQSQKGIESLEAKGSGSSIPATSEEPIQESKELGDGTQTEQILGARNEVQRGRDSNDWYELLHEQQIENGQL